jgi:hypothetical protein
MVENFFAQDLNYLQDFYRYINGLEGETSLPEEKVTFSEPLLHN